MISALLGLWVFMGLVSSASAADVSQGPVQLDMRMSGVLAQQSGPSAAGREAGDGAYRLDTGDRVSILVYGEPDLSLEDVAIRGHGTISFPLIGELRIRGLTSDEIETLITRQLADGYLKKPLVSVSIETYRQYYIKGEVNQPGGYSYKEGLTVEQAIAIAGGLTPRASEHKITVVRESDPDHRPKPVSPGARVNPGDVVTVGESFF